MSQQPSALRVLQQLFTAPEWEFLMEQKEFTTAAEMVDSIDPQSGHLHRALSIGMQLVSNAGVAGQTQSEKRVDRPTAPRLGHEEALS